HHAFGGGCPSMPPLRMVVQAFDALPNSPVLAAKRLIRYLINPLLWRYVSVWRRFKRKSNIHESCWLGPNAWCSTYERQTERARMEICANATIRGLLRLELGGRIVIAEDCYVGDDCILDSAEAIVIGRNTMLAHGVVTKDVPANCLVAGNPARVVRSLLASAELSA